jgi:hypothetical protein
MDTNPSKADSTHAIFLIPELLVQILSELPDNDLKTCYRVSPRWGDILRAHLPPEKLPLPESPPSYRPLIHDLPGNVALHPLLQSSLALPWELCNSPLDIAWKRFWTNNCEYDAHRELINFRITLKLPIDAWFALFENENQIWRSTYMADPPPTAVEVRCGPGARLFSHQSRWRPEGYTDIPGCTAVSASNGFVRIEREKGVRLGDVVEELRVVVVVCDLGKAEDTEILAIFWWSERFIKLLVTVFWD